MHIPDFHDGYFDGLRIASNKLVYLLLRTEEGESFTLTLHGVDTLTLSEVKQGNILFDLVFRNFDELTASDIQEIYGIATDAPEINATLKVKREQKLQLLEINASYGAQGLVWFQTFEIHPSTPEKRCRFRRSMQHRLIN